MPKISKEVVKKVENKREKNKITAQVKQIATTQGSMQKRSKKLGKNVSKKSSGYLASRHAGKVARD